ncbi:hypothetical protein KAR91_24760 [Candidatus Pacearchaeota archaeon]|nr:hypothetical protein [Candidatus Pacearchaeota archaeon]
MANQAVTSAFATSATEDTLINSIVQSELLNKAKLRATIRDESSKAGKGIKQIDLPKFTTSFSGPTTQNADPQVMVDFQSPVFGVDSLLLDQWKNLAYQVSDRVSVQSKVALEAELAKSAGAAMGNWVDDQIIVELKLASAAGPDHLLDINGADATNLGTAITLGAITKSRMLLNKQNADMDNRYLVISPDQEKVIIDLDNFTHADKYGSREALLNGEVGRIYGFRVIVHNALGVNEALAYQKDCCAMAVQKEVKYESQRADVRRQATDYSFSIGAGFEVLQGGKLNIYLKGV